MMFHVKRHLQSNNVPRETHPHSLTNVSRETPAFCLPTIVSRETAGHQMNVSRETFYNFTKGKQKST